MATNEEAIGAGVAGQSLALAAVEMLVKLGHADTLEEVKATAIDALNRSVDATSGIDNAKAKDHGKMMITALEATAKANSAMNSTLRTGQD